MDKRPRILTALLGVLLLLALTACGDADGSSSSSESTTRRDSATATSRASGTTATTAPGTTSTPTTGDRWTADQQAVIDDFMAARAALSESLAAPDPNNPALPATHVDPMLTEVRNLNASWAGFGQAGKFPENSVARIETLEVTIDADSATIETCGVDDSIVYEPATGNVLNDAVATIHSSSTMTRVDGTWKLASRTQIEKWEGVAGCALELS